MEPLRGKSLILTGASMGIGRALALELARAGVNLVLNARGRERLEAAAEACREADGGAVVVPGSAADPVVAEQLVRKALTMGPLAGFIHAAGVLGPGPAVWEIAPEAVDEVMEASFGAAMGLMRAAVPRMLEAGSGLAVFFGSGAAEKVQPGIGAYCAAKAAEEHLARHLAAEAPQILTIIYRPGVVETRMQSQAREAEGGAAHALRPIFQAWKDQGVLLTPEQSAKGLMRMLADDPERFHGQVVDVRSLD